MSENLADMPMHAALQKCANDLISDGAVAAEVYEAMMVTGLAGMVEREKPMGVARRLVLAAMGIVGADELKKISDEETRH